MRRTSEQNDAGFQEFIRIAKKAGATEAIEIGSEQVIVDPRVRMKCLVPPCSLSGICLYCPPHGSSPEQTRKKVERYEKGVFFCVEVPPDVIARPEIGDAVRGYRSDRMGRLLIVGAHQLLIYQIAALLEKRAREKGFKPAGFVAAACKELLCFLHEDCSVLARKEPCRHPDLARPAMEACGMDVFRMAASAGWEIYPIGRSLAPEDVPRARLCGLVLIA